MSAESSDIRVSLRKFGQHFWSNLRIARLVGAKKNMSFVSQTWNVEHEPVQSRSADGEEHIKQNDQHSTDFRVQLT